uniref:Putative secreted protein n=1 Tax=Ixodes ricinus TaxID=34613 RepID=A0A6B0U9U3_IXORI
MCCPRPSSRSSFDRTCWWPACSATSCWRSASCAPTTASPCPSPPCRPPSSTPCGRPGTLRWTSAWHSSTGSRRDSPSSTRPSLPSS